MAKIECELKGEFSVILNTIDAAVMGGSVSASREDASEFIINNCRCSVRVYERYSFFGGNRVSLNVTLFQVDERIKLSAITSGGSQAVFFKLNTVGEESFLETIREAVQRFI